jgi:hypothetical protein
VVTYTWKVLHTTTADKHDGVLLEVVTFTRDVGDNFYLVGEAHLGYLTKG